MLDQLDNFNEPLRDLVRQCLTSNSKRLRSVLLFYSGWHGAGTAVFQALIDAAVIIEWVHWATLAHDDILDAADLRHNRPTLNKTYGTQVAVLLGDDLFAHALRQAAGFPTTVVCRTVARATHEVCSGEIRQTLCRSDTLLSRDSYFRIIELKTAALFVAAAQLGAELSGYDVSFVEAATTFGRNLGIAYQIYDDFADFFGRESRFGKTLGTDWQKGKQTLPFILLRERADGALRDRLTRESTGDTLDIDQLQQLMAEHAIPSAVERIFERYLSQAEQALRPFGDYPATEALLKLSTFLPLQLKKISPPEGP